MSGLGFSQMKAYLSAHGLSSQKPPALPDVIATQVPSLLSRDKKDIDVFPGVHNIPSSVLLILRLLFIDGLYLAGLCPSE